MRRLLDIAEEVISQRLREGVKLAVEALSMALKEERLDDEVVDKSYDEALLDVLKGADRCKVMEAVVLRLLERASDHAVYIANHAYYLVTGQTRRR